MAKVEINIERFCNLLVLGILGAVVCGDAFHHLQRKPRGDRVSCCRRILCSKLCDDDLAAHALREHVHAVTILAQNGVGFPVPDLTALVRSEEHTSELQSQSNLVYPPL